MAATELRIPRSRGRPSIYHLAEVRLGGAFPFLGQAGAGHRRQVCETFTRAVDQGLDLSVSLVLITGNLFGGPLPSGELAEFAREQIRRFAERNIPVLVAAGSLDSLYERSYAAGALTDLDRVTIFPSTPKLVELPDVGVTVLGASWSASPSQPVQADFLSALANHRVQQHVIGAVSLEQPETDAGTRALRRQIAACGAYYLALGGSPARRNLSSGKVTAWSPGGIELVAADPGEGSPLLVQFDSEAPVVTPKPIGKCRFAHFTLQPSTYGSIEEVTDAIRSLGDPNLAARISLTGATRINQFIDVADLRTRLASAFLALDIVDETLPETLDDAGYPDLSVAAKFVGVARAEMERATTQDARRHAGAALRLGLSLLEGRRPL